MPRVPAPIPLLCAFLVPIFLSMGCGRGVSISTTATANDQARLIVAVSPTSESTEVVATAKVLATASPTTSVITPTIVPSPTPVPVTSTPVQTTTPTAEEPSRLVIEANDAMGALHSYKMDGTGEFSLATDSSSAKALPIHGESDGHNLKFTWGKMQYLTYDGIAYERQSTKDPWKKSSFLGANPPGARFLGSLKRPSGVSLDLRAGTVCQVITAETTDKAGITTQYRIWIGLFDHLVRREEERAKNNVASIGIQLNFYDFNVPVVISGPTP